jgi:hypothetical protein
VSVCSFVTPDGRRCVLEAPHATSHQVEESPAPPPVGMDDVQSYTDSWRSASSDERLVRSRTVTDRVRELTGYAHPVAAAGGRAGPARRRGGRARRAGCRRRPGAGPYRRARSGEP